MTVFCDTSMFVAALLQTHPHHAPAKAALLRIHREEDAGYASTHALAETFAVLSRLPSEPKLQPEDVLQMLEHNILPHLTFLSLQSEDYLEAIRGLAAKRLGGGRVYDTLHLQVARKLAPDRIHTFNENEWKKLAPDLASLICAPPSPEK